MQFLILMMKASGIGLTGIHDPPDFLFTSTLNPYLVLGENGKCIGILMRANTKS